MRFDPAVGGEIKKTRPAVIVSTDRANEHMNRVTVVPLTSATSKVYVTETVLTIGARRSKTVADQIRTVSKDRFGARLGVLSKAQMAAIDRTIRLHLELT